MYLDLKLVSSEDVENISCEDVSQDEIDDILTYVLPQMEGICSSLNGYGLAAPQVGINKNFFIMRNIKDPEKFDVFFNAKYFKDGNRVKIREGCLSYQLGKKNCEIKRFKSVKILYQKLDKDENLVDKVERAKSIRALGFQHEIDHLKGITIFMK